MNLSPTTTVKQLIEHLQKFDPNLPIYIGKYVNRTPYDGEGTDMSCHEPSNFSPTKVFEERNRVIGQERNVNHKCVYIDTFEAEGN